MTGELDSVAMMLDDVVRSVPGVAALYSAQPAIVRSARELTTGAAALVVVRSDRNGVSVIASVGVVGDRQARATAQAVSEAIRDALVDGPAVGATVHVRVSRIAG